MKHLFILLVCTTFLVSACRSGNTDTDTLKTYFSSDTSGVADGGVRIIPIKTLNRTFNVWTKRFGNNPKIKLLLLNGGPGATHEYFEVMESFLPAEGIEFIYYDQLGTGNSDNPNDTTFWSLPRYVEEVEQVRAALNLTPDNFYLLGHSWGGILAMQYALKYGKNLKGLVISNMMSSCPDYGKYADNVLAKQMDPAVVKEVNDIEAKGAYTSPRYMELLMPNFYAKHICRIPLNQWPEPMTRALGKSNQSLYVTMQGPSEFGIAGNLTNWDVKAELPKITAPTLTIGAKYDTMDPEHMKWMATQLPNGSYLYCPNGSHMAMYDDQKTYMKGLIKFIKGVDTGEKKVSL
ncbi:proline iminopeptidase-family hydrolase [Spirosoma pollinicola]|uniref:Proline iminopeptidase n=1 Tax=Spirosoma pollinicola TaxID=2057025 RepID=A0A2K8YSK1_9BACT|nr:proline iminopeptidase-family hydrolase [Spirosoma pollinicola]AUD00596.1 proline iminopeptidase [Spirosoma pollinicola]